MWIHMFSSATDALSLSTNLGSPAVQHSPASCSCEHTLQPHSAPVCRIPVAAGGHGGHGHHSWGARNISGDSWHRSHSERTNRKENIFENHQPSGKKMIYILLVLSPFSHYRLISFAHTRGNPMWDILHFLLIEIYKYIQRKTYLQID